MGLRWFSFDCKPPGLCNLGRNQEGLLEGSYEYSQLDGLGRAGIEGVRGVPHEVGQGIKAEGEAMLAANGE